MELVHTGLARLGRRATETAGHVGRMSQLVWGIAAATARGQIPMRDVAQQMYAMGVQSLPLVLFTAMLSGVVTSQQGGYQFTGAVPLYVLGSVVASSIILELGPVITAIVLIGRVGARITAELGTMQVSEQVDALYSLGRDPVRTLAAPRVLAGIIVIPVLVALANTVGLFSGMVAARATVGLGFEAFFYGARVTEGAPPIEIEDYEWSADERKLLIFSDAQRVWRQATKGTYYVYDIGERRLVPVSRQAGWQLFAKFSPDGSKVGFVRDNNLFVTDLATGAETQLTRDGSDNIINGTTDWVYEEELDLRDAWRWSPDGKRIAFWRFDQSPVALFTMLDPLGQYPVPVAFRYPKAGTANSRVRVGVIDLADGATRWFEVGGSDQDYLARMDWIPGTDQVVIQRLNRHQNRIDVLVGDAATGRTRELFTERDSAWVDVDDDMTWLKGGRQFLWSSERDGFNHVYLYDAKGAVVRQVTRGRWDVNTLYGVDEAKGWVYFAASVESPMQRHIYRIRLSGRDMEKLGEEAGTHRADFSPDFSLFVGSYSAMDKPPVYRLMEADGRVLRVLEENDQARAAVNALALPRPEFVRIPAADGVTQLNVYIIRPRAASTTGRHPVLMYVYGGPGSQTVTDAWGGTRYLWHQMLAQKGYVVVSVDNRGTGARGRDFKKATYLNLGRLETDDQIAAARHLGTLSYVDPARIGIWGWSYGGYMSALSLGRGGDVFRAAVSVAPVTDWKLYDTIYTERFMRTPQENPAGYRDGAPLHHTSGMTGDLLLVHGTGDDNVHDQNTMQLVQALIDEGKQFDLMLYPNRTHSITGGTTQVHLFTMITNWLDEHLMQ